MPKTQKPTTKSEPTRASDPLFVRSIEKGLRVIYAFGSENRALGLTQIATATGLGVSAAQRFIHTWEKLGYLKREPNSRRYLLSPKLLDFSFVYQRSSGLVEIAMPHLIALGNTCQETIHMLELESSDVLFIVRLPRHEQRFPAGTVGARVPAFCTSSGRAILAYRDQNETDHIFQVSDLTQRTPHTLTDRKAILKRLAEVRRNGYSIVDQEVFLGEISIAAPILDYTGNAIAAVSIPVSTARWSVKSVKETLAPHLLETARAISRACGGLHAFQGA